ncbi:MAG: hypothetical protein ACOZF0_20835 [Thermodesulfobacteriota bacterium]
MNLRHRLSGFRKTGIVTFAILSLLVAAPVSAELSPLSDTEMDTITGRQGLSEFTIEGNTARIFFDIHVETYMEVDSLKLGYYQKSDAGVGTTGDLNTAKWSALGTKSYNNNYAYVREFGSSGPNLFEGLQGDGQNMNTHDWDINWENVKLGKSKTEPLIINGLIMQVEFDDINATDKKLKRVVMGTNDMQGQLSADMLRTTGLINPMTTTDSQARALASTNPADGNPLLLKRDSLGSNWDNYVLNAGDHDTGFWVILNFGSGPSGETDHIGWEIISGYDERAVNFSYKDGIENVDLSGY